MKTHDENGNMIDHEPIDSFISDLDSIPSDEWRARTLAFESFVGTLPQRPMSNVTSGITPWYRSATALRRLHIPISSLLLDARSTVAKHTCQHLAFLVQRTTAFSPPNSDVCKYLLKDLLPSILGLHAQTVKVIKTYAVDMMSMIIPSCRFKSGLPILLERLRKDKSRDVREGCVRYLHLILRHWTKEPPIAQAVDVMNEEPKKKKEDYLTKSICVHIGNGMARALMDSSQSVRTEARTTFEAFRFKYPSLWNQIVQKQDGILSKDARLKKNILNAAIKADAQLARGETDDYQSNSFEDEYDGNSIVSERSKDSLNSWNSLGSFASKTSMKSGYNKRSASVGRPRTGLRGGAVRLPTNAHSNVQNLNHTQNNNNNQSSSNNAQVNQKLPPSGKRDSNSPPNDTLNDTPNHIVTTDAVDSLTQSKDVFDNENKENKENGDNENKENDTLVSSFNEVTIESNDANVTNHRNDSRKSSILLQERLKGTDNPVSNENSTDPSTNEKGSTNENLMVANQLLSAHKLYIDELMENLRLEMNVVRDFEGVVSKAKKGPSENEGEIRSPTEEEVLNYFETVYGFLDKSADNGMKLRKAMDRVSRAEFQ